MLKLQTKWMDDEEGTHISLGVNLHCWCFTIVFHVIFLDIMTVFNHLDSFAEVVSGDSAGFDGRPRDECDALAWETSPG